MDGVAGGGDYVLIERGEQPDGTNGRKVAQLAGVGSEHPGLRAFEIDRADFVPERSDPLPRRGDSAAAPPTRQVVIRDGTIGGEKAAVNGCACALRIDFGA